MSTNRITVQTTLDDDEYLELRVAAAKKGYTGVAGLVTAELRKLLAREAKKAA